MLLGLGGGSIASEFNKLNIKADLIDIDKRMFDISKKYFYYNDSISTFYLDDARHYVNTSKKKYDLIVIDLLGGENQPSNLFTKEGFEKIFSRLHEDGIVVVNYQELLNNPEISAHHSICNTVLSLGMKVQFHNSLGEFADIVIVIPRKDLDLNNIPVSQLSRSFAYLGEIQKLIQEPFTQVKKRFHDGIILTDNLPMLDILNAETIRSWRNSANKTYLKKQLQLNLPVYH